MDTPQDIERLLNTPIADNLAGEDPAIRQLFNKEEDEPFSIEDVLAMKEIVRSAKGSLSEAEEKRFAATEALFRRREKHEKMAEEDAEGFQNLLNERAAARKITNQQELDALRAQVSKEFSEAMASAGANRVLARSRMEAEEKVSVNWPAKPKVLLVRSGQSLRSIVLPEEVRINNVLYRYPVGKLVQVPRSVANELERKQRDYAMAQERKTSLDADRKLKEAITEAAPEWDSINRRYGLSDPNPFDPDRMSG